MLGWDPDAQSLGLKLVVLLVEKAPDSLPLLIQALENDPSDYVREEAMVDAILFVDEVRMRLRATEIGRKALEAVRNAVPHGKLNLVLRRSRELLSKELFERAINDNIDIANSEWAVFGFAFEQYYGVVATRREHTSLYYAVLAVPEMRDFMTYLTKVDPFYPSWEYTYASRGYFWDQMLHPRFKQKIARYYEEWKKFKAQQSGSTTPHKR